MRIADAKGLDTLQWGMIGLWSYLLPALLSRVFFSDDLCAYLEISDSFFRSVFTLVINGCAGLLGCYIPLQVLRARPYLDKKQAVVIPREMYI